MIGHEEGIEAPALQRLGEPLQMLEVEVRIGEAAGIAPPGGMYTHRAHEGAEPKLPGRRHCPFGLGKGRSWNMCIGRVLLRHCNQADRVGPSMPRSRSEGLPHLATRPY